MDENLTNKLLNDIKAMLHVNNVFLAAVVVKDFDKLGTLTDINEILKEAKDLIEVSSEALKRNSD